MICWRKKSRERNLAGELIAGPRANLTVRVKDAPPATIATSASAGAYTASYFNCPPSRCPRRRVPGGFTLLSDAVVSHLLMNAEGKAAGVAVYRPHHARRSRGPRQDCGAGGGALESTRILLNSRSRRFPEWRWQLLAAFWATI